MNAVADLLAHLSRLGVELVPRGDRLRYRPRSAVTPDLVERLRTHKTQLLAILRHAEGPGGATVGPRAGESERVIGRPEPVRWEDAIDPPDPGPACGGLLSWRNALGNRRCLTCNPPRKAIKALERVERIRRRLNIPSPPGAAEMLADLRRLIGT